MSDQDIFLREPTRTTPYVRVDYASGLIEFRGRSSPENTMEFYDPILKAIDKFLENPTIQVVANFHLLYFNTSSARCFFLVIKALKKLQDQGMNVTINWHASEDDEDMQETGLDFQDIVEIDFNICIEQE